MSLKQDVVIVIPARYGSSRLPGKPLLDIGGKPMIQHVYERAKEASFIDKVIVATDDQRIYDVVLKFGGECQMTDVNHSSGTDRLVEVSESVSASIYINLQGDEPLIHPDIIATLAKYMLDNEAVEVGTLCHSITEEESKNPNSVKVVVDNQNRALYFSRSPIPYPRSEFVAKYLKHVGIYAYRREVLQNYNLLPSSMLEQSESLEQLRLLEAGLEIRVLQVDSAPSGVDTPECLEKVRSIVIDKIGCN